MNAFVAFVVALFVSTLLTPLVRRAAQALGVVDHPNWRKVHHKPIPRMGGVAVYFGWVLGIWSGMTLTHHQEMLTLLDPVLALAGLVVVLGLWDDYRDVTGTVKLTAQWCIASLVFVAHIRIDRISNPFGGEIFFPWWISYAVTVAWVVGVMNAMNLIDGLDGLASGVSAIIAYGLMLAGLYLGSYLSVILLAALAGASLGFLRHNFHPASIFLGDSGSQFLGFVFAVAALIEHQYKAATAASLLLPLAAMALPILDTALAIVRRLRGRQSLFHADRLHLHHRLLRLGMSHRGVVLAFYLFSGYLACLSFLFVLIREQYSIVLLLLLGLGLVMAMQTLQFVEWKLTKLSRGRVRTLLCRRR